MNIDPDRAYTIAGLVVDAIGDHYDTLSLPLPERRLVVPGLPAYDCPMVAVHVERIFPHDGNLSGEAQPQLEGEAAYYLRAVALAVYVLRCVPALNNDGSVPAVELEETAAADILRDPVHLWRSVLEALEAGELPGCGGVAWLGWESLTPEGLLGGGVLRFLVSLE